MPIHRSQSCTPLQQRSWLVFFCIALCVLGALILPLRPACAAPQILPMDHLAPLLAGAKPHGRIDAARTLSPEIVLPLRDRAGLDDLIRRLYDPKDPLYGRFLKPGEFTERFGPSVADVNAVAAWAQSKGMRVVAVTPNRTLIRLTGPARTVEAAFGVQVNTFTADDGRSIHAPDRAVTIPSEIAGRVLTVLGLDNVAKGKPALEQTRAPGETQAAPLGASGTGVYGDLSPADVHSIYNIPSGTAYNGSGLLLGLYEEDGFTASDITTYENQYTGGSVTVTPSAVDGFSTSPTDDGIIDEVTLDIDMLLAVAPDASEIKVYECPGDTQGFQQNIVDTFTAMANDDAVNIISVSYGLSEDIFSTADLNSADNAAAQMVSQGQEVCVCTQDDGAYVDQSAGKGPNVSFPGSLPYVTAVGATDLTDSNTNPETWVSETCWADTADKQRGSIGTGGGGGISSVWGIPSWQSPVIPPDSYVSTTYRNLPDVCLYGDFDDTGYSIYLTKVNKNPHTSGWYGYNGTSAACPLWAGFLAVVDEQRSLHGYGYLGFANPALYALGANAGPYARDYHDIADNSNNLFYHALPGYDDATGLGTINSGGALVDDLITTSGYGAPSNDDFANAIPVTATPTQPSTRYGTNVGAGFESGEPGNTEGAGGSSVWWKWTAPANGTATISTAGTDYTDSLGIYTGSAVNALTQIASNDGRGCSVTFTAVAGITYSISVDGDELNDPPNYPADEGFITLTVSEYAPPPSNDDFANAYTVVATPAQSSTSAGTNYGATFESGEPYNTRNGEGSGGHSVWWVWTAPGTGTATIDTFGSSFDTTLGVYVGSAVSILTQVASDDDAGGTLQSQVSFNATAGARYYISVDGYYINEGNITLHVAETGVAAPGNDAFVNRYTISAAPGSPGTATGNNAAATSESGEPLNTEDSGGHTIWWSWTAPVSSSVTIDTLGSGFDTTLGVYTGSAVSALTLIASNDDISYPSDLQSSVTFNAVAGTTYQIPVDGYSYNEGSVTLHVTQAYPAPTITSFTPASGVVGTHVTITGTRFTGATAVKFNGTTASFSVTSDTQITTTVPSGAATGTITVTNPSASATSSASFTVTSSSTPTITSFTPTSGPVGTSVTITGTNFTGATAVKFDGTTATTFHVASATSITATVPTGAATGTLAVTTPSGTATSSGTFTVLPPPTVTSFTPTSGGIGTSITITGTNFMGATSVLFNGTKATTSHVVNATTVTATVPAGATTGKITVTTPGGSAVSSATFTVVAAPTITSFTPTSGPVGTSVTITGTNIMGSTSVMFNGTKATTSHVVNTTTVTATVPTGATTGKITVTTPGGTATSSATFTVVAAPTITSFSPTTGGAGTSVTITGTNFTGATAVKFNGTTATTFHVASATSITATVPTGATTGKITVTTPGGTATSSGTFTVTPAPTITSFTPTSGPVGTSITITGTNIMGSTSVLFNGTKATTSHVVNTTTVTATVPTGATTGKITVTTPGGSAVSSGTFTVN